MYAYYGILYSKVEFTILFLVSLMRCIGVYVLPAKLSYLVNESLRGRHPIQHWFYSSQRQAAKTFSLWDDFLWTQKCSRESYVMFEFGLRAILT